MNQNYCLINKNKIYCEIYDELLDEELSMNNIEHNNKIKTYIEKKIINSDYINLSETFVHADPQNDINTNINTNTNTNTNSDIISDLIISITSKINNNNLQGNTVLLFADSDNMYELFHMEDLTKSQPLSDDDLNEFASISNIHLLPIYWGCGIFKTSYSNGTLQGTMVKKQDIAKIFIQNYYHNGVMVGLTGELIDLEFTGEDPFKVIGNNFTRSDVTNIMGFNMIPYIETNGEKKLNEFGSKILGKEVYGRIFITILCPTTNKKYWNISSKTILDMLKILDNSQLFDLINKELELTDKDINPFYLIKKIKC